MAAEVNVVKERNANPINGSSKPMTRARQRNAIMNARVEPSSGTTRIDLGNNQSAQFRVTFVNQSQGRIDGTLNLNSGGGSNRFIFGGRSGRSFEEALMESKQDMRRNI